MRKLRFIIILLALLSAHWLASGQNMDTGSIFVRPIVLDTFTVSSGFDVQAFIRRVRNDTTFYKAFRSLHLFPCVLHSNIEVIGKNGLISAARKSDIQQVLRNNCRTTHTEKEIISGKFYKRNHEYKYYTTALFDYLFTVKEPACNENDIVSGMMDEQGSGRMERSKHSLKQLIFNPGSGVNDVPLMADRASIYNNSEARKYDFSVSETNLDGTRCYLFRITPRKGFEKKVVYDELTTWFRKSDYTILARDYAISFHTVLYDFNVKMKVRTTTQNNKLLPAYLSYDGNWHIFTQRREHVKFTIDFEYPPTN